MSQIPVEDAIARIGEYNAAMELPYAGLVGLNAYLAAPPARNLQLAEAELKTFIELAKIVETVLEDALENARKNLFLHAAFHRIFRSREARREFRDTLARSRSILESLIREIHHAEISERVPRDRLGEIAKNLESLSQKIKEEIPRDAYLSSITGVPHPFPSINRQ